MGLSNHMNSILHKINSEVYKKCSLKITELTIEKEGQQYDACEFKLSDFHIIYRKGNVTPKKVGQFVTFWKRNPEGITTPYTEKDSFDFYVVTVCTENKVGQFVFPKSILITKGIVSSNKKGGKRGFRVYPSWDITNSKQAAVTQKWQLDYFYSLTMATDFKKVASLYSR